MTVSLHGLSPTELEQYLRGLSPTELARATTQILREDDPSFSNEDVTRVDNVQEKVPLGAAREAGVLLDSPLTGESTARPGAVAFDDPASGYLDDIFRRNALGIAAIELEALGKRHAARALWVKGDYAGAEIAFTKAKELLALAASTRRHLNQNVGLFGDRLARALDAGEVETAERYLVEAITSDDADYAMKVACVRALVELQALTASNEPRVPFGATWIAERAGLSARAAQRLIKDAREIESGVAALLIETEYGGRKDLQALMAETPAYRCAAIAAVRECLTEYRIRHAMQREHRQRKLSLMTLSVLDVVGLNIAPVREMLAEMTVEAEIKWLAVKFDEHISRLDLSERREKKTAAKLRELKAAIAAKRAA